MYKLILLSLIFVVFLSMLPSDSFAHKSGCHRWHSCPSDSGSYECGDLGYDDYCSDNGDSKENDDDNEQEKDEEKEQESSTVPKSTITEGIELSGPVTYVVDGDTLDVNDVRIRLALVDTPEIGEIGYESAKNFVEDLCLGNDAQVDIDDGQRGGDRYGREIGIVYCNAVNVNSELIDKDLATIYTEYCDVSEFANDDWAECSSTNTQFDTGPVTEQRTADNPDLDCSDFDKKNFKVQPGDPYDLDRDGDGIGCES
jgi:endonuclease YncB( thermonuclease family)